jgi:GGDEF domain-containing protein
MKISPPSPMVAAVRSKELLIVDDSQQNTGPNIQNVQRSFSKNYETSCCIIAPLICHGRVVGVLNMSDKAGNGRFTADDIAVIELFRQLIGASIGNISLFEKTQRQAKTDGLTGMLNHRTFYETLEAELRRAQRYGGNGHRAGDMAIKQIARRISACIRQIDVAARYGGDEFSVILPNTTIVDAAVVAERMVAMVKGTPMLWEQSKVPLSISVGVGQYDGDNCAGDVAKTTDQALYAAKQAGKGRVYVFEPAKV